MKDAKLDPVEERIISAARDCLIHHGLRATVSEVARRAGMSRPTIYRKYASLEEITGEVLTQEFAKLLNLAQPPQTVAQFIDTIVRTTVQVRHNELIQSIIADAPEFLLTYQFHRLGRSQIAIIDVLQRALESLPEVRKGNTAHQALFILMLVQSAALMANTVAAYIDEFHWEQELRKMLEGYLQ